MRCTIKFYLSHSIRGKHGKDATHAQQEHNCQEAINIANTICDTLQHANLEVYCPAEHEDFVQRAYDKGYITEKQILDVDCAIIDNCDGVIIYVPDGDTLQGGRLVEYNHAVKTKKPVCVFHKVEQAIEYLTALILRA